MVSYNVNFELSVEDVELIESALRLSKRALGSGAIVAGTAAEADMPDPADVNGSIRRIQDLLGRLHNQKVFYRPRSGTYVGG